MRANSTPDLLGRYAWGVTKVGTTFIYYELVDEWRQEQRPGTCGGTLTIPVRTGRRVWTACVLWAKQPLEVSGDVLAAIEADQLHLKNKSAA